jgi:class 3 adenylate cyclase
LVNSAAADNRRLLRGILPDGVAAELKEKGSVEPAFFPDAAVIFTDFERFSETAARLPPSEIIGRLHAYFSEFDGIVAAHGLEKIKTIGDSYMAVAGVPCPHSEPVLAACDAALQIMDSCKKISGDDGWKIRIGVHVGPLVAGVIGKHKFSYDVWGETVNLASRMESSSTGGRINVSSAVHDRAKERYTWEDRGIRPLKGRVLMEMHYLLGKRSYM